MTLSLRAHASAINWRCVRLFVTAALEAQFGHSASSAHPRAVQLPGGAGGVGGALGGAGGGVKIFFGGGESEGFLRFGLGGRFARLPNNALAACVVVVLCRVSKDACNVLLGTAARWPLAGCSLPGPGVAVGGELPARFLRQDKARPPQTRLGGLAGARHRGSPASVSAPVPAFGYPVVAASSSDSVRARSSTGAVRVPYRKASWPGRVPSRRAWCSRRRGGGPWCGRCGRRRHPRAARPGHGVNSLMQFGTVQLLAPGA
jgi:hypothetical protein